MKNRITEAAAPPKAGWETLRDAHSLKGPDVIPHLLEGIGRRGVGTPAVAHRTSEVAPWPGYRNRFGKQQKPSLSLSSLTYHSRDNLS